MTSIPSPQNTINPQQLSISTELLYQEAGLLGIECFPLDQFTLLMKKDGKEWYLRGSRSSFQSSVGFTIAEKKDLSKIFFSKHNIPTAKYLTLSSELDLTQLTQLKFPIVMKPSRGSHGTDVYVGIEDIDQAHQIFAQIPLGEDFPVMAEELLEGVEYRVICLDYKFVAAAMRTPAFVVGNGYSTIKELVSEKNQHPWREDSHMSPLSIIELDSISLDYLNEQSLDPHSIPNLGQKVFLKKTANLSQGGEASNSTDLVCPENIKLFEKIARACDLNIVGIDVICQDIRKPIIDQPRAGIIEINPSPGLRMHHFPVEGEPINLARKILKMIEDKYLQSPDALIAKQ